VSGGAAELPCTSRVLALWVCAAKPGSVPTSPKAREKWGSLIKPKSSLCALEFLLEKFF
jgi:hypothetical protein